MGSKTYGSKAWNAALKRAAAGRPPRFMVEEAAFDRMLREANIALENAASYRMVQDWVRRNYTRHYVPETVLAAMGIGTGQVCGPFPGEAGKSGYGVVHMGKELR